MTQIHQYLIYFLNHSPHHLSRAGNLFYRANSGRTRKNSFFPIIGYPGARTMTMQIRIFFSSSCTAFSIRINGLPTVS